jgi:hypothetical protein
MAKRAGEHKQLMKGVLDREANIALVYKFLKEGKTIKWIEDFFADHQALKPITVRIYLMEARKLIATEADMDVDFTSLLHDARYEKLWESEKDLYLQWHFVTEEAYQRAQNMEVVRRYADLLKSLKQRENMYGLREKDLVLALHSNISLTREYKADSFEQTLKIDFDIEKLTLEEQVELLQILEESYEGDLFQQKEYIVENDEEIEQKTKPKTDSQKSLAVTVEGIEQIKPEPEKPKKIISRTTSSISVKDYVPGEGKSAQEVSQNLEQVQKKVIKIKFNKK